jgi:hypothetical protein
MPDSEGESMLLRHSWPATAGTPNRKRFFARVLIVKALSGDLMVGNKPKYKVASFIFLILGVAIFLNTLLEIYESDTFYFFEFIKGIAGTFVFISIGLAPERLFLPMSRAFQKVGVGSRHEISDKLIVSGGLLALAGLIGSVAL